MKFLYMSKELNGLSHRVLSHWFLTVKSSHASAGKKIGQWRKRGRGGEGRGPTEWRCDLDRGKSESLGWKSSLALKFWFSYHCITFFISITVFCGILLVPHNTGMNINYVKRVFKGLKWFNKHYNSWACGSNPKYTSKHAITMKSWYEIVPRVIQFLGMAPSLHHQATLSLFFGPQHWKLHYILYLVSLPIWNYAMLWTS